MLTYNHEAGVSLGVSTMAEDSQTQIKTYQTDAWTAPYPRSTRPGAVDRAPGPCTTEEAVRASGVTRGVRRTPCVRGLLPRSLTLSLRHCVLGRPGPALPASSAPRPSPRAARGTWVRGRQGAPGYVVIPPQDPESRLT